MQKITAVQGQSCLSILVPMGSSCHFLSVNYILYIISRIVSELFDELMVKICCQQGLPLFNWWLRNLLSANYKHRSKMWCEKDFCISNRRWGL